MQATPETSSINVLFEDEILSPESYVFVALMSVEEGPNKASFLQVLRNMVSRSLFAEGADLLGSEDQKMR